MKEWEERLGWDENEMPLKLGTEGVRIYRAAKKEARARSISERRVKMSKGFKCGMRKRYKGRLTIQ